MLDKELEQTLNEAFSRARDQRHEFITVEHLLFALLDNVRRPKCSRPVVQILTPYTPSFPSLSISTHQLWKKAMNVILNPHWGFNGCYNGQCSMCNLLVKRGHRGECASGDIW